MKVGCLLAACIVAVAYSVPLFPEKEILGTKETVFSIQLDQHARSSHESQDLLNKMHAHHEELVANFLQETKSVGDIKMIDYKNV